MLTTKSEAATPYDSLTFNGEYYLNEYPDVKNAVGSGNYWGAYSHFVNYGINEGRRGSPYFDVRYYLNKYSDLQRAFGANYAGAYNHFVNCGINENRSGSPYIDPEYYASKYSDIRNAFGSDYSGIYNHFYTNGIKEGRRGSKYFDVGYYLNTNQDLLKTFGRENYAAAFNHFLTCGINELRDPSSDINIDCYLNSYTDLQKAFGNNKNYRGLFEHCYTNSEADKRTTNHKIVDITIKTEPTCTERGQVGGTQCERCGKIIVSPIYKPALGHDWEEPVFNWEGTDKCTVKFTCKRANHPQTLDAVITSEEKDGTVVYTATVTVDGETYTNVKNGSAVPGPGTGGTPSGGGGSSSGGGGSTGGGGSVAPHTHTYGQPTWSWNSDNKTATATFKCTSNDITQTATATGNQITSNVTKEANCTTAGSTTFTATVTFNGQEYTNTKVDNAVPAAKGHTCGDDAEFIWTNENKSATAKFTCTVCKAKLDASVTMSNETKEPAKCEKAGKECYTATATYGDKKDTESKDVEIPATGHQTGIMFTKDTEKGFQRTCTVCQEPQGSATQLNTNFKVESYNATEKNNVFSGNGYKKLDKETWTLDEINTESSTTGLLKNKVKEQTISDNGEGYYITVTIIPTRATMVSESIKVEPKVQVSQNITKCAEKINEDGSVTLLLKIQRLDCLENCGSGSCECESGKSSACQCNKVITITVDGDGDKLGGYKPQTCTIDYCQAEFKKDVQVTFEYKDKTDKNEEKIYTVEEGIVTVPEELQQIEKGNDYHDFLYWCDESGTQKFDENQSKEEIKEDTTFTSAYTLDFDTFIKDVVEDLDSSNTTYSHDYSNNFDIKKSGNTVTFEVKDTTTTLSTLKETSIPGAIAYVLDKGEINDITLSTQGSDKEISKKFTKNGLSTVSLTSEASTLKKTIQDEAQKLFIEALGSSENEQQMTLERMALGNKNFKITVGETTDSKTKLKEGFEKTYTFNFESMLPSITVTSQQTLEEAISKGYTDIVIGANFEVDKEIEITKAINLTKNGDYTITRSGSTGSVFKVGANGNLTLTSIKLTGGDSGITVENDGILTATDLTYTDETYDKPAVKSAKNGATINVSNSIGPEVYEEVKNNDNPNLGKIKIIKEDYNYYNYYLNKEHTKKWYEVEFYTDSNITRIMGILYTDYVEITNPITKVTLPTTKQSKYFGDFNIDSKKYKLSSWTYTYKNQEKIVDVTPELKELEIDCDTEVYASYSEEARTDYITVSDKDNFNKALADQRYNLIYVEGTINLENDLKIDRKVTIDGKKKSGTLQVKNVTIGSSAEGTTLNNITIESLNGTDNNFVTINADSVSLTGVILKSNKVYERGIYFTGKDDLTATIRWVEFEGNKFKTAIEFANKIKTIIVTSNEFNRDKVANTVLKNAIIINNVSEGATADLKYNYYNNCSELCAVTLKGETTKVNASFDISYAYQVTGKVYVLFDTTGSPDYTGYNLKLNSSTVDYYYGTKGTASYDKQAVITDVNPIKE